MKRAFQWSAAALLALVILIQFTPRIVRDNPPVTGEIDAPPEVLSILRRACYDCHSNETRWPWYGYVAPISWLVSRDVQNGRFQLNFSTWEAVPAQYRMLYRIEIVRQVEAGHMPPPAYLWLHSGARLDPGDIERLRRWSGDSP